MIVVYTRYPVSLIHGDICARGLQSSGRDLSENDKIDSVAPQAFSPASSPSLKAPGSSARMIISSGSLSVHIDTRDEMLAEGPLLLEQTPAGTLTVYPEKQRIELLNGTLTREGGVLERPVLQRILAEQTKGDLASKPSDLACPPPSATSESTAWSKENVTTSSTLPPGTPREPGWSKQVQRPFDRAAFIHFHPRSSPQQGQRLNQSERQANRLFP